MLTFAQNRPLRPQLASGAEHASWLIVAAAERLASGQSDPVEGSRYAEAGRRLLIAVRSPMFDAESLRAASPSVSCADGVSRSMLDLVGRYGDDTEAGLCAAMSLFRGSDWQAAD